MVALFASELVQSLSAGSQWLEVQMTSMWKLGMLWRRALAWFQKTIEAT